MNAMKKGLSSFNRSPGLSWTLIILVIALSLLGRQAVLAGSPGTQKWVYDSAGGKMAVGPDGAIYAAIGYTITAITAAGAHSWDYTVSPTTITNTPFIGEGGTVYFGDGIGYLHARGANGAYKWDTQFGISIIGEAAIGAGGYIYCIYGGVMVRILPGGAVKGPNFEPPGGICTPPAIGPDGTVYVGTNAGTLYALNPDLVLPAKWSLLGFSPTIKYIAVGFDGTVYAVAGNKLFARSSNGLPIWAFTAGGNIVSAPVIGLHGTIYVGSDDHYLYAVNPDGSQKWAFDTKGPVSSTPALGADGTVYVGSSNNNLYAINPDGSEQWTFATTGPIDLPILMAADGTVYVCSNYEKIYAVYSSSPGPARSAWPMYQRDARHTGNTAYKWAFLTGSMVRSSPALCPVLGVPGLDSTIYVGAANGYLYAITPDGTIKWSFFTGNSIFSSPTISASGYIIYAGSGNILYAVGSIGVKQWHFTAGGLVSSPAVGADGTVYVGSQDQNLYAVNPGNGLQKWVYPTGGPVNCSPAVGRDGTIYVGSDDSTFHAVTPGGTQKWTSTTTGSFAKSPAVGPDGTVYVGSGHKLHAFRPDGSEKWPAFVTGGTIGSSPAIAADGTIYVGCEDDKKVYAINPNGTQKWTYTTEGYVGSSPAIGADGLIYVGSADKKLYALKPDGTLAWAYPLWNAIWSSPAIGPDGTIYVGAELDLHALYSTSSGLIKSPWPMFRHDPQHTGRQTIADMSPILPLLLFY